jgi:hypothetical protein
MHSLGLSLWDLSILLNDKRGIGPQIPRLCPYQASICAALLPYPGPTQAPDDTFAVLEEQSYHSIHCTFATESITHPPPSSALQSTDIEIWQLVESIPSSRPKYPLLFPNMAIDTA